MDKMRYMISDAAQIAGVESHVLRYWEDELALTVPRNELGHRYYTRENIQEFQKIKELKEQGYQLKAIRMILHGQEAPFIPAAAPQGVFAQPVLQEAGAAPYRAPEADGVQPKGAALQPQGTAVIAGAISPQGADLQLKGASAITAPPQASAGRETLPTSAGGQAPLSAEERMDQFRELMSDIVGRAIAQNNEELSQTIGQEVQERVLKEMDYLMREQEDAAEARYKKLDAAIRGSIHKRRAFFAKDRGAAGKKEQKPAGKLLEQAT